MVVRQLKNLLSFLTVFPVQMDMNMFTDCARNMWAFPLIGGFMGLIVGVISLFALAVLPSIVVGAIAFGLILWLTGLHHTDGLLDFGDAVMVHGTFQRRIEVMHDQLTGSGAIGLAIVTYLVTAAAFTSLALGSAQFFGIILIPAIVFGLILIELCGKLSMVVMAFRGKAVHEGMNTSFLMHMHGRGGDLRLAAALGISLALAFVLFQFDGLLVVLVAVVTSLVMVEVAHRKFGGVTGDVFGATNEITRMICAVTLVAVITWV